MSHLPLPLPLKHEISHNASALPPCNASHAVPNNGGRTMGIPLRADFNAALRAETRSWQRAIAAHVLGTNSRNDPSRIVRSAWPDDARAAIITRGAVSQTTTGGFPSYDPIVAFRSLAPSSAAMALFQLGMVLDLTGTTTIRIPCVTGLPVQPLFIGEGAPAPNVQGNLAATVLGPARKILMLSCVTAELENASADTAAAVIGRVLADVANIGRNSGHRPDRCGIRLRSERQQLSKPKLERSSTTQSSLHWVCQPRELPASLRLA